LGQADALFADEGGDAHDPAAVGTVMVRPPVRAIDGSGGLENNSDISREPGVASGFLATREFVAILKIAELVLQENQIDVDQQVFAGVTGNIVGDGLIPDALFRGGKSRLRSG